MVMREVKPFSDKQWKQITEELANGPTEKSIAALKKAIAIADEVRVAS